MQSALAYLNAQTLEREQSMTNNASFSEQRGASLFSNANEQQQQENNNNNVNNNVTTTSSLKTVAALIRDYRINRAIKPMKPIETNVSEDQMKNIFDDCYQSRLIEYRKKMTRRLAGEDVDGETAVVQKQTKQELTTSAADHITEDCLEPADVKDQDHEQEQQEEKEIASKIPLNLFGKVLALPTEILNFVPPARSASTTTSGGPVVVRLSSSSRQRSLSKPRNEQAHHHSRQNSTMSNSSSTNNNNNQSRQHMFTPPHHLLRQQQQEHQPVNGEAQFRGEEEQGIRSVPDFIHSVMNSHQNSRRSSVLAVHVPQQVPIVVHEQQEENEQPQQVLPHEKQKQEEQPHHDDINNEEIFIDDEIINMTEAEEEVEEQQQQIGFVAAVSTTSSSQKKPQYFFDDQNERSNSRSQSSTWKHHHEEDEKYQGKSETPVPQQLHSHYVPVVPSSSSSFPTQQSHTNQNRFMGMLHSSNNSSTMPSRGTSPFPRRNDNNNQSNNNDGNNDYYYGASSERNFVLEESKMQERKSSIIRYSVSPCEL